MRAFLFLALLLAGPRVDGSYEEGIRLISGPPTNLAPTVVEVFGYTSVDGHPRDAAVVVNGNRVDISFVQGPGSPISVGRAWKVPVTLGALAPGEYEVVATVPQHPYAAVVHRLSLRVRDVVTLPILTSTVEQGEPLVLDWYEEESAHRRAWIGEHETSTYEEQSGCRTFIAIRTDAIPAGLHDVRVTRRDGSVIAAKNAVEIRERGEGIVRGEYERFLVPVFYNGQGTHGTRWGSYLAMHAPASYHAVVVPAVFNDSCEETVYAERRLIGERPAGFFLQVPRRVSDEARFSLQVGEIRQNGSVQATRIPVVRERDFLRDRAVLAGVPFSKDHRVTLRIYSTVPQQFVVTRCDPLGSGNQPLHPAMLPPNGDAPAFASVDLSSAWKLPDGRCDVHVDVLYGDAPFFALITVSERSTGRIIAVPPRPD